MKDIIYFIQNFISKNRQSRWLYLTERKWEKFATELNTLEKHLNEKCILIEKNATETFATIVKEENCTKGTYIDTDGIHFINLNNNDIISYNNSILVCSDQKMAFFFHHEGWIWICKTH